MKNQDWNRQEESAEKRAQSTAKARAQRKAKKRLRRVGLQIQVYDRVFTGCLVRLGLAAGQKSW